MSNYFSTIECAGGCGNLLPQKLVDNGRKYLWGHKAGCPKEGESARRKSASGGGRAGSARVSDVGNTRPGAVEHTSYEKTLVMIDQAIAATTARLKELYADRDTLNTAVALNEDNLKRAYAVQESLRALLHCEPAPIREVAVVEEGRVQ